MRQGEDEGRERGENDKGRRRKEPYSPYPVYGPKNYIRPCLEHGV